MSKLVIQTQHKENYGAHDWDGEGSCPQYWKFKGGNTYVVEGLTAKAVNKIAQGGIPTLSLLIESKSDMLRSTSWTGVSKKTMRQYAKSGNLPLC